MNDTPLSENDIHEMLGEIGASVRPDPQFDAGLRARLFEQVDAAAMDRSVADQAPSGVIAGFHSRKEAMERKNFLIPALAAAAVGALMVGLAAVILWQNRTIPVFGGQPEPDEIIAPVEEESVDEPVAEGEAPPVSDFDYAEDDEGLKASSIFNSLPGDVAYAYSTMTAEVDGQMVTEMRFYRNEYFLIVIEQPDNGQALLDGTPVAVGDFSGVLLGDQAGIANLTGAQLQDGVERPVQSYRVHRDGEIGADRTYPDVLEYSGGYRLLWTMNGYRYEVLSNLPQDHVEVWSQMLTQLADGTLPGTAPVLYDTSFGIRDILADEVYYGASSLEAKVSEKPVVEYRYFGNHDFFMVSMGPEAVIPALEGEAVAIGDYTGSQSLVDGGTADLMLPGLITLDGIGEAMGGGGGGGGGGLTELDTQEQPQSIAYESGVKVQWTVDGVTYTVLTNRSAEDAALFAAHVTDVVTGVIEVGEPNAAGGGGSTGGDASIPTPNPGDVTFLLNTGQGGAIGLGIADLAFDPLNPFGLPLPFNDPNLTAMVDSSQGGLWVELALWRIDDPNLFAIIRQQQGGAGALPGEATTDIAGKPAVQITDPECSTDVIKIEPSTTGGGGGGGSGTSDPPLMTLECLVGRSYGLMWDDGDIRLEIYVNGLSLHDLMVLANGMGPLN